MSKHIQQGIQAICSQAAGDCRISSIRSEAIKLWKRYYRFAGFFQPWNRETENDRFQERRCRQADRRTCRPTNERTPTQTSVQTGIRTDKSMDTYTSFCDRRPYRPQTCAQTSRRAHAYTTTQCSGNDIQRGKN